MKQLSLKLLLVSLLVFPAILTFAQIEQNGTIMPVQQKNVLADQQVTQQKSVTSIFTEDFSGGTVPAAGWTIIGGAQANWKWYPTSNAGGTAPEAAFAWGPPYFSGNSKMVTPVIPTSGAATLVLEFHHFVWDFAGTGYSYKIETTSDGGTTWNEVWSISPTGDIPAETVTLVIDNEDVGSDNFQFACVFDGESSNINYWYFDDFVLSAETVEAYTVTYIVKDEDENPVEGALVNMQSGGTKTTDASGEVIFENILPGDYAWWAMATGLSTEEGSVTVTDADVTVDVVLGISYELLSEYFATGTFPPEGWSVFGDGQSNWSQSFTSNAGGEYPELHFDRQAIFTGNSKFVSPEVVTLGYTDLFLEFNYYLMDNSGSDYSIKVETTSDGGATWNEAWSVSPTGNLGPIFHTVLISTEDVGSDAFQFAFTFDGNSAMIDNWYIDDVVLTAALGNDVGVVSIDIPSLAITGTVIDPAATIENLGSEVVSFDVSFEIIDGSAVYSELLTVTDLAPLGVEMVTFPAWTAVEGSYVVEVTVNLSGDQNTTNDTLNMNLDVANALLPLKPLYEVFTSSTCPPCPLANQIIDSILDLNPNEYTLIKYQMNWPGSGDPYYTEEGGVRRDYYGVSSVPDLYINSERLSPPTSFTQEIFDQYQTEETALEISITEAIRDEDNNISISANLTSIINYEEGLTAYIVVVEKLTTGNVGTNGETEFHYVMMKMLPDASGTTLDEINTGVPLALLESYDMNLTNMETPDDIAVVVFVQDETDKSIIQSEIVDIELPTFIGNIKNEHMQVYPNPATDQVNIKSELTIQSISVYNFAGQIVLTESVNNTTYRVNTSKLNAGIYLFRIETKEGRIAKRIIIE
nr:T9SS type A sorting domain-containing protein [Bacteroidota bacterium]